MNIQIFGKPKCFDTKKAERYFKERGIKFQFIDILRYGLSKGEYTSVKQALGSFHALIDDKSQAYQDLYIRHLASDSAKEDKLIENPALFKTPIVRNGKAATVGFAPDIWKDWK
jgi:arsenate reductase-like glutaredoxin family protein